MVTGFDRYVCGDGVDLPDESFLRTVADLERARTCAVALEQENAELRARVGALARQWGSSSFGNAVLAALVLPERPE
jgi:hypothetical protein